MKIRKVLLGVTLSFASLFSIAACDKNNVDSSSILEEFNLNLDKNEVEILVGESITLTATTNSTYPIVWNSSDPSIVSVEKGVLVALKAGEATIKASISDEVYKECKVKVVNALVTPTLVLNKENLSMMVNGTYTIKSTCMLGNEVASNVTYTYTSSNPEVASVDASGKLSGLKTGETTITVKAKVGESEVSATCKVTVNENIEISLDAEEIGLSLLTLNENDKQSHQIEAEVLVNGTSKEASITYASTNESIASVSSTGLVNAISEGNTTIEITAVVEGKELKKYVDVNVLRTNQENFEFAAKDYSSVMVTTPTSGYLSEQVLSLDVEPYASGLDIKWSIEGTGATLTKQTDNRNIKVTVDQSSLGSSFTVIAILEGNVDNAISFDIDSYVPIASEAAIATINNNVVSDQVVGKYLLTNDIVCQNTYSNALIGSDKVPFVGELDGNGYTISNLKFSGSELYLGVVGKAYTGSYIHNLSVVAEFEQSNLNGGIVGWLNSFDPTPAIVENCVSKVTLANTSRETVWPGAAIAGRIEGYSASINSCYAEVSTIAGNGSKAVTNIGSVIGRSYYNNYKNCYVVVKESDYSDKVLLVGNDQAGTAGEHENNILAYSVIDLYEKGFTSSSLDEKYFEIEQNTISLVKGCTAKALAYISCIPTLSIVQGKTAILSYTSSVSDLVFESDNEQVATINNKGVISAVKQGSANITIKSASNNELICTCAITVLEPDKTNIVADELYTITLYELGENDNNELQLNPVLMVNDVETAVAFTYSIDSQKYATITPAGLLKAIGIGDDATITITAIYDGKPISTQVSVKSILSTYTVEASCKEYKQALLTKEVTGYLTSQELELNVSNYSNDMEITWESNSDVITLVANTNNQKKATVTKTNKTGTATITATVKDFGEVATFEISVYEPISSEADLVALNSKAANNTITGSYILTNDIVMANTYDAAIIGTQDIPFNGSFNGNGYTISNLKFANNATLYKGLFCKLMDKAHIYNLGVEAELATGDLSGAIAGWAWSTTGVVIENCYAKVILPLKASNVAFPAGGILGRIEMWNVQVKNCYTEITVVDGEGAATCAAIGGIIGRSFNGDVLSCYTLTTSDKVQTRGLLSETYGKNEGNVISSTISGLGTVNLSSTYWNISAESISLKKGCTCMPGQSITVATSKKVYVGNNITLNPIVTGSNPNVNYASDNEAVATVDANGVVTGVAAGTANITCTIAGTEISSTCAITVSVMPNVNITVASDNISLTVFNLTEGDSTTALLQPQLSEGTATNGFAYSVNNDNVSVDETGLVTALKTGSAIVTITYNFEGNDITKDVTFTVTTSNQASLTLSTNTYTDVMVHKVVEGYLNTQELSISVTPYADGMNVKWSTTFTSFITLTPSTTDAKKATVTGKDANGTVIKVMASVEGFEGTATFTINYWRAISSEADLISMNSRAWADGGKSIAGNYMLTNDIVMANDTARCTSGEYTQPVVGDANVKFIGTFEGNGYTVSNLKVGKATYGGLFGQLGYWSVVRNLGVEMVCSDSNLNGAIAGWANSTDSKIVTITNCYAKATICLKSGTADTFVSGALLGRTDGWNVQMTNCFAEVTAITGNGTNALQDDKVGAFIGRSYNGNAKNCYAIVTQNENASKVAERARLETTAGSNEGSIIATSNTDLVTKGFTATSLASTSWNVSIEEGTATVALKKGCYFTPVVA